MKSHKVILKFAYSVVGLSVIVVIALTVYQQRQIREMSRAESPAASAGKPSPESGSKTEFTKNTKAPGDSYAALFKKLALSPEKQDTLKTLLINPQRRKRDLSMEMLDTSISEEKRNEIRQRMEILENKSNKKIRELLGTDNFEKYLIYTERLSERTIITAFFRSFGPDEKLSEPREQAFIDAMFEERKKVEFEHPRDNEIPASTDLGMQISHVLKKTDQTYSGYIEVAGEYLSPSRTEQFKNFLSQRRNMIEISLNAMRQVFGSGSALNQAPKKPDNTAN